MPKLLTKTDFTQFYECPVGLWLERYKPEAVPQSEDLEERFEDGNEIDAFARRLFPGGVEVQGFGEEGWAGTQKQIKAGEKILFQPTVIANRTMCRSDILTWNKEAKAWDIR